MKIRKPRSIIDYIKGRITDDKEFFIIATAEVQLHHKFESVLKFFFTFAMLMFKAASR